MAPRASNIIPVENEAQMELGEIEENEELHMICQSAASKFASIINWTMKKNLLDILLTAIAKSDKCNNNSCKASICNMFKIIKRHSNVGDHSCGLTQLYNILIELHVNRCEDEDCMFESCKLNREK